MLTVQITVATQQITMSKTAVHQILRNRKQVITGADYNGEKEYHRFSHGNLYPHSILHKKMWLLWFPFRSVRSKGAGWLCRCSAWRNQCSRRRKRKECILCIYWRGHSFCFGWEIHRRNFKSYKTKISDCGSCWDHHRSKPRDCRQKQTAGIQNIWNQPPEHRFTVAGWQRTEDPWKSPQLWAVSGNLQKCKRGRVRQYQYWSDECDPGSDLWRMDPQSSHCCRTGSGTYFRIQPDHWGGHTFCIADAEFAGWRCGVQYVWGNSTDSERIWLWAVWDFQLRKERQRMQA